MSWQLLYTNRYHRAADNDQQESTFRTYTAQ